MAKRMGRLFHALGLLATDELKEAKASDLLTGYAGQAGRATRELLRQSRGGVLFIDEAYQMNPSRGGHYMTEAVDELVGALTEEEFKGKLLVILAGYEEDMEEMLQNTNRGMRSRFSERVHFSDFDADATVQLFQMELKKRNIPMEETEQSAAKILDMANRLTATKNFGNGRDIVSWAGNTYKAVAKEFSKGKHKRAYAEITSSMECIQAALDSMLKSREVKLGGQKCTRVNKIGTDATESEDRATPPKSAITQTIRMDTDTNQQQIETAPSDTATTEEEQENLFRGVDRQVLRTLQDFVDREGLSSEEGTRRLAYLAPTGAEFANLVARLQNELNMSHADATAQLLEWQSAHKDLEKELTEQAIKTKTLGVRPIWRCGVCGRADKPWIACYVAPFIVGYEKVPID